MRLNYDVDLVSNVSSFLSLQLPASQRPPQTAQLPARPVKMTLEDGRSWGTARQRQLRSQVRFEDFWFWFNFSCLIIIEALLPDFVAW